MTAPRKSVPTEDLERWCAAGWAYVMPDFDKANHSKIEWLSDKAPVEPDHRVPDITNQESASDRAGTGA